MRQDLIDFGINESLDVIKSKSEYSFKNLVKKKAYEYAFYSFLEKKESHSKLDKLFYTKLDTQPYLKDGDLSKEQSQLVFSYRVRMADYSDNYQSYSGHTPCALCLAHLDCQAMSFGCPTITENVTIKGKYNQLFSSSVSNDLATTLQNIEKFRTEYKNSRYLEEQLPTGPQCVSSDEVAAEFILNVTCK